ncbi:AP-3 complex subunit beta-1 [Seminavis robusta]|uniref:AP-3 complex subunit beta-1 n=1 Tax=Seminavis robusta TaxID=568900 RepID=A0A9N8HF77_9STRA|nr:AP-3 complex subunit beta-1 [Seminavis robusta]|eukprot:Sro336_g120290.1 AP-3 complex subunit beta-1 (1360) ;mRNA; f:19086-23362
MSQVVASVTSGDPASLLNAQLASALSTMGDAQFWEENISPNTIRAELSSSDPSNPHSTPKLLKGMKWLLASISKGRDVSDFYPHVVKIVGASSLEVRKMVYMFLVQYADKDSTTRELSLLSINSFQRGLADSEQLIRALALRVLTSIRIPDILQIQILGVQKCSKDSSPYVRKCAANALAKLSPRCLEANNKDLHEMLLEIMKSLLDHDSSTMVLTSCVIAFTELCPHRLELLHTSFRKLCHLLTDMDEWGQVVVIDTMGRYCRKFFREPRAWREGTAEKIDRERRVRRTLSGIINETDVVGSGLDALVASEKKDKKKAKHDKLPPHPNSISPKKVKRRVVKKGFYSDEEDESTEEDVYADGPSLSGVMRQRDVMGFSSSSVAAAAGSVVPVAAMNEDADEDQDLNEDHRLLLRSAMPLLKSRNSGVVLSVCSLQYYCGVSSIKVRSSIGKALVRIHRDRREIQYVVLTSIRTLVHECPSAFAPFLQDFFVMAMDPSFTRMIKLDILTALALEPNSIEAVLEELKTYVRHGDKNFACASVRAAGTVVELARIVYDRHGAKSGDKAEERRSANTIALNCLQGLVVLSHCDSEHSMVVGECVMVMQRILLQLSSDNSVYAVEDPNFIQGMALRRLIVLLVNALMVRSKAIEIEENADRNVDDDDESEAEVSPLEKEGCASIPPEAFASALWIIGEWASRQNGQSSSESTGLRIHKMDADSFEKIRFELCRLIAQSFVALELQEKLQAIHFASKVLVSCRINSGSNNTQEMALCEHILSMGRLEPNPNVRDRARFESNLIHIAIGLQFDTDTLEGLPMGPIACKPTIETLQHVFLRPKPAPSSLPLEDVHFKQRAAMGESGGNFRFGTLSSLVGHRARAAYIPLPPWASEDSPSSVRDPQTPSSAGADDVAGATKANGAGFYDESDTDDESSSSSDSSDSDSDSSDDETSDKDDSESTSSDESSDDNAPTMPIQPFASQVQQPLPFSGQQFGGMPVTHQSPSAAQHLEMPFAPQPETVESSSSDDSSDSDSSSGEANAQPNSFGNVGNLIPMDGTPAPQLQHMTSHTSTKTNGSTASSVADDLRGLVLEPIVVDASDNGEPNIEKESSAWFELVRSQHSGGLSVKVRYLRGKTKTREVQLLGMAAEKSSTVCLQVRFENQKADGGVIRRLRILQRSSATSSSHIGPKKVVVPGEIAQLRQGQMSSVMVGIDFASPSDRDESLQAKFDIKFNGGSIPVEVRPPLVHLMQSCQRSDSDFGSGMAKLQGFNRVDASFSLANPSFLTTHWILKHASFTPVSMSDKLKEGLRFVGCLPASGDPVFVLVACSESGVGKLTVCCEQALAVNGITNSLKKAIAEASKAAK